LLKTSQSEAKLVHKVILLVISSMKIFTLGSSSGKLLSYWMNLWIIHISRWRLNISTFILCELKYWFNHWMAQYSIVFHLPQLTPLPDGNERSVCYKFELNCKEYELVIQTSVYSQLTIHLNENKLTCLRHCPPFFITRTLLFFTVIYSLHCQYL